MGQKTTHIVNLRLIGKETQEQDTFVVFVMHTTKIASSCFYCVKSGIKSV